MIYKNPAQNYTYNTKEISKFEGGEMSRNSRENFVYGVKVSTCFFHLGVFAKIRLHFKHNPSPIDQPL
jgi:hypothetical protein